MKNSYADQIEIVDTKTKNHENSFTHHAKQLTRKFTNEMAASIIAKSNFPLEESLPRFSPTPFNNFGHSNLFDYKRFLHIIWDSAEFIKSKISFWDRWLPLIITGLSFVFTLLITTFLNLGEDLTIFITSMSFLILLISILLITYFSMTYFIENRLSKKIAEIRIQLMQELLADKWQPSKKFIHEKLKKNLSLIGEGKINDEEIPVIVFFDEEHPFPGFGNLFFNNQFVCKPKNTKVTNDIDQSSLFIAVSKRLNHDLEQSRISNFISGKIISVPADSLNMNSSWLDQNKVPILTKDISKSNSLVDDVTSRLFFTIQVILPKHSTAISFFIRTYKAANSVACHIYVTTIGPPSIDKYFFGEKLSTYKAEKNKVVSYNSGSYHQKNKLYQELKVQEKLSSSNQIFKKILGVKNIIKTDPLSLKFENTYDFNREKYNIVQKKVEWPGGYYYPLNYREQNSLDIPNDYFGRSEVASSIKTLYDQISRSVLKTIENQGYDVSNYKDKDGNYSINAEKIDKLIVGENIKIEHSSDNKSQNQKKERKDIRSSKSAKK